MITLISQSDRTSPHLFHIAENKKMIRLGVFGSMINVEPSGIRSSGSASDPAGLRDSSACQRTVQSGRDTHTVDMGRDPIPVYKTGIWGDIMTWGFGESR